MPLQKRLQTFLVVLTLILSTRAAASPEPILEAGLNAFQQGKYDEARQNFLSLVNSPPWKFAALYNLGNTAVRQSHLGEALGFYSRALSVNPWDRDTRQNLRFVMNALSGKRLLAPPSNYDVFRDEVLGRLTFSLLLLLTFFGSAFFLWTFLSFLRRRKLSPGQDRDEDEPTPAPLLLISASLILVFFLSLTTLKLVDTYTSRGVVTATVAPLRSGPAEANASLMDVPEGSEVQIQDSEKDWLQVTPVGTNSLTGWIPKSAVMAISGGGPF